MGESVEYRGGLWYLGEEMELGWKVRYREKEILSLGFMWMLEVYRGGGSVDFGVRS